MTRRAPSSSSLLCGDCCSRGSASIRFLFRPSVHARRVKALVHSFENSHDYYAYSFTDTFGGGFRVRAARTPSTPAFGEQTRPLFRAMVVQVSMLRLAYSRGHFFAAATSSPLLTPQTAVRAMQLPDSGVSTTKGRAASRSCKSGLSSSRSTSWAGAGFHRARSQHAGKVGFVNPAAVLIPHLLAYAPCMHAPFTLFNAGPETEERIPN